MNLTEFLQELSKTRNGWEGGVCIRKPSRVDEHCPITAVCVRVKKTRFDTSQFDDAGARLGLSPTLIGRIVDASDALTREPRLRSRLLKAVGLK